MRYGKNLFNCGLILLAGCGGQQVSGLVKPPDDLPVLSADAGVDGGVQPDMLGADMTTTVSPDMVVVSADMTTPDLSKPLDMTSLGPACGGGYCSVGQTCVDNGSGGFCTYTHTDTFCKSLCPGNDAAANWSDNQLVVSSTSSLQAKSACGACLTECGSTLGGTTGCSGSIQDSTGSYYQFVYNNNHLGVAFYFSGVNAGSAFRYAIGGGLTDKATWTE